MCEEELANLFTDEVAVMCEWGRCVDVCGWCESVGRGGGKEITSHLHSTTHTSI